MWQQQSGTPDEESQRPDELFEGKGEVCRSRSPFDPGRLDGCRPGHPSRRPLRVRRHSGGTPRVSAVASEGRDRADAVRRRVVDAGGPPGLRRRSLLAAPCPGQCRAPVPVSARAGPLQRSRWPTRESTNATSPSICSNRIPSRSSADRSTIVADQGSIAAEFEGRRADHDIELIRPARNGTPPRRVARQLRPIRQLIESIDHTLKGRLGLGSVSG